MDGIISVDMSLSKLQEMVKDREWHAAVHEISKSWYDLATESEKAMAPHSSTLAWKIPWTEEPGIGCSPWGR